MAQQFISEPCSWFHREQNKAQAFLMEAFSGIGLNRLGSFSQCHNDSSLRYSLFEYQLLQQSPKFYSGICYSSNCTANDLMIILKSINQYFPLPFTNYRIYEPIAQSTFWNGFSIAMITILSIIATVSIISTTLYLCKKLSGTQNWKQTITIFSIPSSFYFMFRKTKNNQRIKIIAGLRAFAFFGMTLFNLNYGIIATPSLPQPSHISPYLQILYYSFDIWLMVSGFYLSFQLCKNWSKYQSIKNAIYTILRKTLRIILVQMFAILFVNTVVYCFTSGPLWTLTFDYFETKCNLFNIFGECNYWLWVFTVEIQMQFIGCLFFILWQADFKFSRYAYYGANFLFCILAFVVAMAFDNQEEYDNLYISRCPLISGTAYLIGFNLGLMYFSFRTDRNKTKILIIRIITYKINRILLSIISLSLITLIQLYFIYIEQPSKLVNRLFLQLFHIVIPISFSLLILPEMVGFQNLWGALFKDRFMNVASRLSFVSYSLYLGICLIVVNTLRQDLYVNVPKLICIWVCTIGVSLVIGLIICGLVEIPLYRLIQQSFGKTNTKAYIQFY